jgi:hypothetical protein
MEKAIKAWLWPGFFLGGGYTYRRVKKGKTGIEEKLSTLIRYNQIFNIQHSIINAQVRKPPVFTLEY